MEIRFDWDKTIFLSHPWISIDEKTVLINGPSHSLSKDESHSIIHIDDFIFLYDTNIDQTSVFETEKPSVYLADITNWYDHHLQHLEWIGWATFVIPFPTVEQSIAIDFCREVMMKRLGTPKYFVPGQSLSLL